MDRTHAPRRSLRLAGRLVAAATSLSLVFAASAFADQLEQHNELASKFIDDMHADPLVADCAAHANFVARTSTAFDHVDFPPGSLDSAHASVTPWNDSFNAGKQRVKVDTIVTVEGLGVREDNQGEPADLKFRCGYVGTQMLAFSWNDPVPAATSHSPVSATRHKKSGKGKHGASGKISAAKSTGKTPKKSAVSKPVSASSGNASPAKTGAKKTAPEKKQP